MDYSIRILKVQVDSLRQEFERTTSINHESHSEQTTKYLEITKQRIKELEKSIKILQEFNFKELPGS